jgi:hypothetical protein
MRHEGYPPLKLDPICLWFVDRASPKQGTSPFIDSLHATLQFAHV